MMKNDCVHGIYPVFHKTEHGFWRIRPSIDGVTVVSELSEKSDQ